MRGCTFLNVYKPFNTGFSYGTLIQIPVLIYKYASYTTLVTVCQQISFHYNA